MILTCMLVPKRGKPTVEWANTFPDFDSALEAVRNDLAKRRLPMPLGKPSKLPATLGVEHPPHGTLLYGFKP